MIPTLQLGQLGLARRATGGGGNPSGNTAWSATDVSDFVVSGTNNVQLDESSSANAYCRSAFGKSSGKWYAEIVPSLPAGSDFDCAIGIRRSDQSLTTAVNLGKTVAMRSSGTLFVGDTGVTGSGIAYSAGNVVRLGLDLDAGTLKYQIGAGTTTTVSGIPAGTWLLFVWTDNSGAGDHRFVLNTGVTAFAHTPFTGFSSWKDAV